MTWNPLKWFGKAEAKKAMEVVPFRIVQPVFEDWNSDDVAILRSFLGTRTGQKLVAICGSQIFQQSMKEAHGDALQRAAGMDDLLRFQFNLASQKQLEKLSEATAAQVANQPSDTGELNDADALLRSF